MEITAPQDSSAHCEGAAMTPPTMREVLETIAKLDPDSSLLGLLSYKNAVETIAHAALTRESVDDLMEYDDEGQPVYLHSKNCPSFCDYACNGKKGEEAARKASRKASQPRVLVEEVLTLDCVTETISGQYDHHFLNYQTATSLRIRRSKPEWKKGDTVRVSVREEE